MEVTRGPMRGERSAVGTRTTTSYKVYEKQLVLAGLGLNEKVGITLSPRTRLPHLRCPVGM